MSATPRSEPHPPETRPEERPPQPMARWAAWLVVISMALALIILFGSWAFLAERARVDVRADRADAAAAMR